jgi:sulfur carrier protein ThiS
VKVELRRYATLAHPARGCLPGEPEAVDLADGATIADLLRLLRLPAGDVHLVIVDGRICHDRAEVLRTGARVALFPPVGGG